MPPKKQTLFGGIFMERKVRDVCAAHTTNLFFKWALCELGIFIML